MSQQKTSDYPLTGYDIDEAYKVKSEMPKSGGLVDMEFGGHGIPLVHNEKIERPSTTVPIQARIPSGVVNILPGPRARWRIVGWVKFDKKYRREFRNRKG